MQATTKASTLGLGCLLTALAIRHPDVSVVMRALSIGAFVMLTTAVSAHVIARAAALTGAGLWKGTLIDERDAHLAGGGEDDPSPPAIPR